MFKNSSPLTSSSALGFALFFSKSSTISGPLLNFTAKCRGVLRFEKAVIL